MDKYRTYDKSTDKIKETDLTEAEKTFVDGLLESVSLNFNNYGGGEHNIGECLYYFQNDFYNSLKATREAEVELRDATSGEIAEAEEKLIRLQTEFKNDVVRIKRNLKIADELDKVLDIASNLCLGKNIEYSERISGLRDDVKGAILNLKGYLADGQEVVDEINKKQVNP